MGSSLSRGDQQVRRPSNAAKRICVIGSGSSGLVAVKVIKETTQYKSGEWDVVAFEARSDVGGIW
jgi:cation diffusion facilitator CzcD-associated flavoprotein CzcO